MKNKDISIEAIKKWSAQILRGLAYLHSRSPPIIHKDLKCSNLYIDGATSAVRIGDLGLASHVNKNSMISGTLVYMAPETLDMYAFGMCLLELLTRKSPYCECTTTGEFLSKVLSVGPVMSIHSRTLPPLRYRK